MDQENDSEIRRDYRTGFFSIIVPGRSKRPHELEEDKANENLAECPFEPQNILENLKIMHVGEPWKIMVIKNKFPELNGNTPLMERGGFFSSISGYGYNEIVIESPDHRAKFENMSIEQLNGWLDVLIEREQQLYLRKYIKYVQIFRNYGVDAGASIGHPHTQIMAWPIVIGNIKRRLRIAADYKSKNNSCLYEDAVKKETARNLYSNSTFDAVAPFGSRITAESLIIPKRHINSMIEMTQEEKTGLSDMLKRIVSVNKLLFGAQSYNILFYELKDQPDFHMHVEVLPRLSTLAGVELGQNVFVNTIVPEQYAAEFKSKLSGA